MPHLTQETQAGPQQHLLQEGNLSQAAAPGGPLGSKRETVASHPTRHPPPPVSPRKPAGSARKQLENGPGKYLPSGDQPPASASPLPLPGLSPLSPDSLLGPHIILDLDPDSPSLLEDSPSQGPCGHWLEGLREDEKPEREGEMPQEHFSPLYAGREGKPTCSSEWGSGMPPLTRSSALLPKHPVLSPQHLGGFPHHEDRAELEGPLPRIELENSATGRGESGWAKGGLPMGWHLTEKTANPTNHCSPAQQGMHLNLSTPPPPMVEWG